MQQIVYFFIKNKNFLLFMVLFLLAITFTINSHNYHKNRFINSANFVSGGIYSITSNIRDYLSLKEQNELLSEENNRLRALLVNIGNEELPPKKIDSNFTFITSKVINNSFSKTKNQLTIKKGKKDGVEIDMGVISPKGIVGIVSHVSTNYASVQSLLNTKSQIVAKFKKTNHFGTLIWDAKKINLVQLKEIPRIAPVAIGDTIVTDGKSTIFPEGIPIGTVSYFEIETAGDYYKIDVKLFNDMTSIKHIYLIKVLEKEEIKELEKEAKDVE